MALSRAQRYVRVTLRTGRLKINAKEYFYFNAFSVSLILGSERDFEKLGGGSR